ncbi:MAG: hypothetical protein GY801_21410 [bacterium]|nr:hypothetical protein [bacterium]
MFKSIKSKMMLLGGVPLVVAVVFMLSSIVAQYSTMREMNTLLALSHLAVKIGALIHETQKERGATGVFMGSGGAAFVDELSDQREKTNEKRAELENFIEPIDRGGQSEEFHETLNNAVNKLSMLDEHREDVNNQSIPDEQGLDFLHST